MTDQRSRQREALRTRGAAPLWRASVGPALTALPPSPRRVTRGVGCPVRLPGVSGARGSDQPRTWRPALRHWHASPRWPHGCGRRATSPHAHGVREQWETYHKEMLDFRNKVVAHLDISERYNAPVPCFDPALQVAYAYDEWVREVIRPEPFLLPMLSARYEQWRATALSVIHSFRPES